MYAITHELSVRLISFFLKPVKLYNFGMVMRYV